jgi:transposase
VQRDTVSEWIDRFTNLGISGLRDAPKSGRPRKLSSADQDLITQKLQSPTPQMKPLLQEELKKGG